MITPEQLAKNGLSVYQYAVQNNEKFYFTGKPCKYGHVEKRYTTSLQCVKCSYNKARRWAKNNPDKIISAFRKKKYGIDNEQLKEIVKLQENKCAICQNEFKNKRNIHVDHNHKTGKLRKILCRDCNTGLGNFKDDVLILLFAIEYLNKYDNT